MNYFSYLADEDISYVHQSSLEILEEVGLLVRNEKARKRFAEHGAIVDHLALVGTPDSITNTTGLELADIPRYQTVHIGECIGAGDTVFDHGRQVEHTTGAPTGRVFQ